MSFSGHVNIGFLPPGDVRRLQDELLRRHVRYCADRSPFYREWLAECGLDLGRLTVADLPSLPLTGKDHLARQNDAFLAVPMARIVDVVLSSGTTGTPTRIMYTEGDLQRLAYNEHQSFLAAGLTADDVVLLTCTMDRCFVAGLAYFLGVRSLGATAIRHGHGTLDGVLQIMSRVSPTAIVGVPSFLRKLGQFLRDSGLDPRRGTVRRLICIGEPVRGRHLESLPLAMDLEEMWPAGVYSTYASSETITSFCECSARQGGHLLPDLGLVEILGDDSRPVPDGEVGEVVVTPLAVEGMPFLRFRTGDMSFLIPGRCACGRTSPRLGPILGRKAQMLKLKGTTLYPQAIATALTAIPGVGEYYLEVSALDALSDQIVVHLSVTDPALTAALVQERMQASLRVKPDVLVEPEAEVRRRVFTPESRKPVRFIDKRAV